MGEHRSEPQPRKPPVREPDYRKVLRYSTWILAITNLGYGGSYVLGGIAQAPSLLIIQQIMPIEIWGSLFVIAALLMMFGKFKLELSLAGYFFGFSGWIIGGISSWTSFINQTATSAGGPWIYTGFLSLHLLALVTQGAARRDNG